MKDSKPKKKKSKLSNATLNKPVIHQQSLFLDGKKYQTLIIRSIHILRVAVHITLFAEPKSQYLGHFSTQLSQANQLNRLKFIEIIPLSAIKPLATPIGNPTKDL